MSAEPTDVPAAGPTTFRGLTLFPFQREAMASIFSGHNVIVAAPTGAGKTLVADYAITRALEDGGRVVYTSPIKALSNQKFRDFREEYGEQQVGLMTGDVTLSPDAALLIMTTEIFRNTIFESPERLQGFDFAIFDEVHYLDDRDRGTVWEEALIYMPAHMRTVCLSATVPNVDEIAEWLAEERKVPVDVILEERRPVPLTHKAWIPGSGPRAIDEVRSWQMRQRNDERERARRRGGHGQGHRGPAWGKAARERRRAQRDLMDEASGQLLDYLERRDLMPAIYFCFSRRECEIQAERNARRSLLTPAERRKMLTRFDDLAERYEVTDSDETLSLRAIAAQGVLFHHAGMLPIDKEIVERLFNTGLVKLLFATETFALGVNMPARTVCFHALTKFDGQAFGPLKARDYWQMAGRAGRQGIDEKGWVFSLFDETEIDYRVLEYLQSGRTEPVLSRFNLNYSAILNLYKRLGDRVPDAWERSLARFQRKRRKQERAEHKRQRKRRRSKQDPASRPPKGGPAARLITSRLEVLEQLDYVRDDTLTRKGLLCARINGYEIAVTEAYEAGYLFRCDPVQAAMLFAAIVYEARPRDHSAPPRRHLKGIAMPFIQHMESVATVERAAGIRTPTRGPDFGLGGPVQRWAEGAELDEISDMTTLQPGDFVRVLRMTIQLLRQVAHVLPREDPVVRVVEEARARIDRDEVDAKRQLSLG